MSLVNPVIHQYIIDPFYVEMEHLINHWINDNQYYDLDQSRFFDNVQDQMIDDKSRSKTDNTSQNLLSSTTSSLSTSTSRSPIHIISPHSPNPSFITVRQKPKTFAHQNLKKTTHLTNRDQYSIDMSRTDTIMPTSHLWTNQVTRRWVQCIPLTHDEIQDELISLEYYNEKNVIKIQGVSQTKPLRKKYKRTRPIIVQGTSLTNTPPRMNSLSHIFIY